MSDDYKNLPSIDDFAESSEELPSVAELLEEEDLQQKKVLQVISLWF